MTDQQILSAIRDDVNKLSQKIEAMHAELKPVSSLFRGNGKPSLEARIFHAEKTLDAQVNNTRWAMRWALGSAATAIATVLWYMITAN